MNNNYNSNTVIKQDFAVVKQVDGRVKSLESNCNVLFRKIFFPKKLFTGEGERLLLSEKNILAEQPPPPPPLPDHAGSIPGWCYVLR